MKLPKGLFRAVSLVAAIIVLPGVNAGAEILGPRLGPVAVLNHVLSLLAEGRREEADQRLRDFLVAELSAMSLRTGQPVIRSKVTPAQAQPIETSAKTLVAGRTFASEGHTVLGVLALLVGEQTEAEKEFSRATTIKPSQITPRLGLALTYRLAGKTDAALQAYAHLVKLHPSLAAGHVGRAEVYYSSGNRPAAIKVLEDWKHADARNPEPANVLGLVYAAERRYSLALSEFASSLAVSADYAPAMTNRADVLLVQGNRGGAIEAYRAALQANKQFVPAYLRLGTVHAEAGELTDALAVFERAIAAKLQIAPFYNNAAWIKLKLNQDIDDALTLAQRAVELDPSYADARGTLGWACLQNGQIDRAIVELRRSKDLAGDRPENSLHLGTAYYRKNLRDMALDELTKVTRLFPKTPEAAAAEKLIAAIRR